MKDVTAIDGSKGALKVRRIVAWRRLEPGDRRTPGTEIAPESAHLEARVFQVGIAESTFVELERLTKKRDEVTSVASGWSTRYEPAGVLLAIGGGLGLGGLLDYMPTSVYPVAGSLALIGAAVGVFTRRRKTLSEREIDRAWRATDERVELERFEKKLRAGWERFASRLSKQTKFRTDIRVGDVHEADRLVSIDLSRVTHPDTWRPDTGQDDVRYGWAYVDGRVVMQQAELEDTSHADSVKPDESAIVPEARADEAE